VYSCCSYYRGFYGGCCSILSTAGSAIRTTSSAAVGIASGISRGSCRHCYGHCCIDRACAGGACADGAFIDKACADGACIDRACNTG
jgi:hypothetical protein